MIQYCLKDCQSCAVYQFHSYASSKYVRNFICIYTYIQTVSLKGIIYQPNLEYQIIDIQIMKRVVIQNMLTQTEDTNKNKFCYSTMTEVRS